MVIVNKVSLKNNKKKNLIKRHLPKLSACRLYTERQDDHGKHVIKL